jgi:hypothetical protein
MSSSASTQNQTTSPSLFQIAAYFEDIFPPGNSRKAAAGLAQTPVAEFMRNPEKLKSFLMSARPEHKSDATQRAKSQSPAKLAAQMTRSKILVPQT